MKLLVTGAAGFIGFHTARRLLARGDEVVGLDNLNEYYDVRLKHKRLDLLKHESKFRFVPLFWIASDDHDLAEIEGCSVLDEHGDVRRFRVPLSPRDTSSAAVRVPAAAAAVVDELFAAIPSGPHQAAIRSLATPAAAEGERWPVWFARCLSRLFAGSGLVLFEPHLAQELLAPVLSREAEQPARELSHGEQRQLELAIALAATPRLLLLDEPAAGLSPDETQKMVALVRALKGRYTIVLIEHKIDVVMTMSDRISVMHFGRVIAQGTPTEIQRNAEVRRAYLGGVAAS